MIDERLQTEIIFVYEPLSFPSVLEILQQDFRHLCLCFKPKAVARGGQNYAIYSWLIAAQLVS